MSGFSIESYLLETLVWTAALIAAVLVLRRPVARWFGPQIAYALWALPMARLLLPPIELPAWMRPAGESAPAIAERVAPLGEDTGAAQQIANLDPALPVATHDGAGGIEAAATDGTGLFSPLSGLDYGPFIEAGLAIWLIGAALFLYLRFAAYFQLRDELLDGSSEVGRDGAIRLIETPGTRSPIAFGVVDKVIALPPGFLAHPDRQARDLALAHEMAHHRGQDLLVNVLVQPLFALHWFNPLSRYGWLALRRDQEAACDARVIAARPQEELGQTREAYANLIVSFAAKPDIASNRALVAPMACPVLGEKSIVHRLRSLRMNDTPKSHRLAGRVMLGAALVALPLTATISYAASEAPVAPIAPEAPLAALAPKAPPAPPAPPAPLTQDTIVEVDPNVDVEVSTERGRGENVFVMRSDNGEGRVQERRWVVRRDGDKKMSEEEIEAIMAEVRAGLDEAHMQLKNLPMVIEQAMAEVEATEGEWGEGAHRRHARVEMSCDGTGDDGTATIESADGTQVVKICRTQIMAHAAEGLREARDEIAADGDMDPEIKARVLRELDQQIERWKDRGRR